MDIGKKIKEIRTEKLMTQSQLAGDEITRNMLSLIENGAALPSLGTVMYLAKRLGVPAGVLLCEDEGEYNFKKSGLIKKIKDAFERREYALCLDMCKEIGDDYDDEIVYIATVSSVRLAEENLIGGQLFSARALLQMAVECSKKTVYDTSAFVAQACVLFDFLSSLSPMLDADSPCDDCVNRLLRMQSSTSPVCRYINALWEIENGSLDFARAYFDDLADDSASCPYSVHVKAKFKMADGEYNEALSTFRTLLDCEEMSGKLMMYLVIKDMEICCRNIEDYRGAYEFSETKLSLIESMLKGGL